MRYNLGSDWEVCSGLKPATKFFRIMVAKMPLFIGLEKKRQKRKRELKKLLTIFHYAERVLKKKIKIESNVKNKLLCE